MAPRNRRHRPRLTARPATRERWDDLEAVFGPRGGHEGCWCMYWRVKRSEMGRLGVKGRRAALRRLAGSARPPGILYYMEEQPVGWCSLGPREDYTVFARSPLLRPVDELPTWSLVCFLLRPELRGRGLLREMVALAVEHARGEGAARVEAYPREAARDDVHRYMGVGEVYRSLGFREIARRKQDRPILRLEL